MDLGIYEQVRRLIQNERVVDVWAQNGSLGLRWGGNGWGLLICLCSYIFAWARLCLTIHGLLYLHTGALGFYYF